MVNLKVETKLAVDTLRDYLSEEAIALNNRLPAERQLSEKLGLSRGKLRTALAQLESEGLIWRHVGRGTFIGPKPVLNLTDIEYLNHNSRPTDVIEARLAMEPQMAKLAALHGNKSNFSEMHRCIRMSKKANEWREYESWDNNFHQAIAEATRNPLLISFFDTLNIVRRSTVWGQLRPTKLPPKDFASFSEHNAIYEAIAGRDPDQAAAQMRLHLKSVQTRTYAALDN